MSGSFRTQVGMIAMRSIKRTFRQPALVVPTITFPLILLAVNSSGLSSATKIPGFPTGNYLNFALTVTFMQGALFSSTTAGTELAGDIESGFLDRLQLTPLRGTAILFGQLAGSVGIAFVSAIVYLFVGLIAGADLKAGAGGAVVLVVLATTIGVGFSALGAVMAARTGSTEAVQGLFPLLFVTLFLSSTNLPRNLIAVHWFRDVASWNPVSYMVEGLRSLIITGWDSTALWRGFAFAVGISLLALFAASRSLRSRMART